MLGPRVCLASRPFPCVRIVVLVFIVILFRLDLGVFRAVIRCGGGIHDRFCVGVMLVAGTGSRGGGDGAFLNLFCCLPC